MSTSWVSGALRCFDAVGVRCIDAGGDGAAAVVVDQHQTVARRHEPVHDRIVVDPVSAQQHDPVATGLRDIDAEARQLARTTAVGRERSEERRAGKGCGRTCRYRVSPYY